MQSHPASLREFSLIPYSEEDLFPLENLPFGCFRFNDRVSCCTRISDFVIDLRYLQNEGHLFDLKIFNTEDLNVFIESGKESWTKVRRRLQELFMRGSGRTIDEREMKEACHRI